MKFYFDHATFFVRSEKKRVAFLEINKFNIESARLGREREIKYNLVLRMQIYNSSGWSKNLYMKGSVVNLGRPAHLFYARYFFCMLMLCKCRVHLECTIL